MLYALAHAVAARHHRAVEGIVFGSASRSACLLLRARLADYVWERRRLEQSLKMTKTEVSDEHRQSEGNPEAKSALRQRQRAMARKRMMAAVPKATVVVTNPTHYAVALLWDDLTMDAPVLVAKGADLIAKRIRDLANEHDVPVLENPAARAHPLREGRARLAGPAGPLRRGRPGHRLRLQAQEQDDRVEAPISFRSSGTRAVLSVPVE